MSARYFLGLQSNKRVGGRASGGKSLFKPGHILYFPLAGSGVEGSPLCSSVSCLAAAGDLSWSVYCGLTWFRLCEGALVFPCPFSSCRAEEVQVCFLTELMAALIRRGESQLLPIPPVVVSSPMGQRMGSSSWWPLRMRKSPVPMAPSLNLWRYFCVMLWSQEYSKK